MRNVTQLKLSRLFIFTLLLVVLTAPMAWAQKATVIKIATLAPDGSPWIQTLQAISDDISKKKQTSRYVSEYIPVVFWVMKTTCSGRCT